MNAKRQKVHPGTTSGRLPADCMAWIALLFIIVFAGLIRYRLLDVPLERDEGEYAYAGQLILQGIPPYKEVYNMKFPGIYAAYAAILAVFGQTHQGIHAGLLLINEVTIVLVFLLAKRLLNASSAVTAAAVFAVLSLGADVNGVSANAEHFVTLFAVAGFVVMLRSLDKNSLWGLFAAGVLLGISFLMKQHSFVFVIVAMLCLFMNAMFTKPVKWRRLLKTETALFGGVMLLIVGLCLTMVWAGVFKDFWFWTVQYAKIYIEQRSFQAGYKDLINNFSSILSSSPLLWTASGLGIFCLASGRLTKSTKLFLFLYAVFSFVSIFPGFYFRPHYFLLMLPCAALLAGTAGHILSSWLSRPPMPCWRILLLLTVICIGQSLYQQRDFLFHMTPSEACRAMYGYGTSPFIESLEIASFISSRTTPQDTIAILGSEPQICFYADRRSASGHIYMYPLMRANPFALRMQEDFIRETESGNPKYIVFIYISYSWLRASTSHNLIFEWAERYLKNFRLIGTTELYKNTTVYRWDSQVQWPLSSVNWITIFERKENRTD